MKKKKRKVDKSCKAQLDRFLKANGQTDSETGIPAFVRIANDGSSERVFLCVYAVEIKEGFWRLSSAKKPAFYIQIHPE